jgi:hypothetical protein
MDGTGNHVKKDKTSSYAGSRTKKNNNDGND